MSWIHSTKLHPWPMKYPAYRHWHKLHYLHKPTAYIATQRPIKYPACRQTDIDTSAPQKLSPFLNKTYTHWHGSACRRHDRSLLTTPHSSPIRPWLPLWSTVKSCQTHEQRLCITSWCTACLWQLTALHSDISHNVPKFISNYAVFNNNACKLEMIQSKATCSFRQNER